MTLTVPFSCLEWPVSLFLHGGIPANSQTTLSYAVGDLFPSPEMTYPLHGGTTVLGTCPPISLSTVLS